MTVPPDAPPPLRSSFGAAAAAYAEHRPGYALDAVRWALEPAPGRRVLDLGAGTGKLTTALLAVGADVVSVEPDAAMLTELRRALPDVAALPGSAEAIPVPDGSVDAVLAGHALHWFDMATAGPEIARVTAPDGVLAGLWNVFDDRVDWVAELARLAGDAAIGPRDLLGSWRAATGGLLSPTTGGPTRFSSSERREFAHDQRQTVESLVARIATHAGVLVMPDTERRATLRRLRRFLDRTLAGRDGEVPVPMLTAVLRVRCEPRFPVTSVAQDFT